MGALNNLLNAERPFVNLKLITLVEGLDEHLDPLVIESKLRDKAFAPDEIDVTVDDSLVERQTVKVGNLGNAVNIQQAEAYVEVIEEVSGIDDLIPTSSVELEGIIDFD